MEKKPELNRRHTLTDDYRRITGITPTHGVEFDLVRRMYAGYIHIEYTYGNPVISEYPFHLPLNVINVLLGKVAGLADVVITVEEFRVCEVAATCKGEMVIVMDGFKQDDVVFDMYTAITKVDEYIESGMRTKEAIGLVAKEMACKKNELYEAYHKR